MKRKITDEHEEFRNGKGIDVYYNELTGVFYYCQKQQHYL